MDVILLISKEPERWEFFKQNLSPDYKFLHSKIEDADLSDVSIVAIDEFDSIKKVAAMNKKRVPVVFFYKKADSLIEIKVRQQGVADFFSLPVEKELLLLRFQNVAGIRKLIKTNDDYVGFFQAIRRETIMIQDHMAQTIAQTVESRDENTGGHIARTAMYIGMLGEEFVESDVITRDQLSLIVRAAPLHDVGKIAVRDSILLKPGPLTDSEREEMMSHSQRGADLIKKMQKKFESHTYLRYAYDIALNHHENFDGTGYPNGIKGEEIPFWARLMSVVDVYDALVSDRVYRKGMPKEKAIEIIFSGSGSKFDPKVLKAFENCKDYMI